MLSTLRLSQSRCAAVHVFRRQMMNSAPLAAPTISMEPPIPKSSLSPFNTAEEVRRTTDDIGQKARHNYYKQQQHQNKYQQHNRFGQNQQQTAPNCEDSVIDDMMRAGTGNNNGETAVSDEYGSFSSTSRAAEQKELSAANDQQPEISVYDNPEAESADSRTSIGFGDRKQQVSDYLKNSDEKSKGLAEFNRFKTLNTVLGGFRPGEFTIFSGTTGVGKTTFLTEYCLDLAQQGVRTLFCSFEMSNAKIMETILLQYCKAKIPLHDPKYHDLIDLKLEEIAAKIPNFRFFNEMQYKKLDEPLVGSDGKMLNPVQRVFQVLEKEVRRERIGHLIIDNLQYLMGAKDYMMESAKNVDMMGNRFVRQDNFIRSLRSLSNERDVHISLVIHPRKEGNGTNKNVRLGVDSIYGGGRATQEADNVMIIQKPRMVMNGDGVPEKKKYLWILKNRYEGDTVDDDRLWMKFNRDTKCHEIIDEMPPKSMHDD